MSAWRASPLVVGHRGGRGEGWPPENTMGAFERAREQGALAVELDVRTCAGGRLVVFHDSTLARMTGQRDLRSVGALPLEELQAVDLGAGQRIPTLEEVLAWSREGGVALNVEMKHDVPSRRALVMGTTRAVREARADVLLSSFDPSLLAAAAVLAPAVPRALLTHTDQSRWAYGLQEVVRTPVVQALHLERTQAEPGAVARCLRRGLRVGVWTVNAPGEALDLVAMGAASIITDTPRELLAALRPIHT